MKKEPTKIKAIPVHLFVLIFSPKKNFAENAVIKYPVLTNGYIKLISNFVIEDNHNSELIA